MTNYDSFSHCHLTDIFFAFHAGVKELSETKSVISVQRAFQWRFGVVIPSAKNIRRWYKQFEEAGCVYKRKRPQCDQGLQRRQS